MMLKKKNKKYGIVFWITSLSGSGKSSIGNKVAKEINKSYGKTIIIHGDDIRNIYNFKIYKPEEKLKLGKNNSNLYFKQMLVKISCVVINYYFCF